MKEKNTGEIIVAAAGSSVRVPNARSAPAPAPTAIFLRVPYSKFKRQSDSSLFFFHGIAGVVLVPFCEWPVKFGVTFLIHF